jgi:pimeloyl-ACP methyl ester carboxylesterase
MVGLLDAIDQETAVIAGHDWGAPVAWHAALLRPDRFRAVIGLSVPFIPRGQVYPSRSVPETEDAVFYQSYFQSPGVAEADLEHDVRLTVRTFLHGASGDAPRAPIDAEGHVFMVPRKGGLMANQVNPASLPPWLTEADVDVYVDQFKRTGQRLLRFSRWLHFSLLVPTIPANGDTNPYGVAFVPFGFPPRRSVNPGGFVLVGNVPAEG